MLRLVRCPSLPVEAIEKLDDKEYYETLNWAIFQNMADWDRLHHKPQRYDVPKQPEILKGILLH
ncbi:MAG: hypothetical protein ACXW0Q_14915 [Methylovulum sp.]